MNQKERIIEFSNSQAGAQIDNPFIKFPKYQIARHESNRKWFALFMPIKQNKIGLRGDEIVEVLDVKVEPELIYILKNTPGYFQAYHMDKNNWITVVLDETVEDAEIMNLIKDSFNLTQ